MKRITMRLTFILVFALLAGCSGTANPNTENREALSESLWKQENNNHRNQSNRVRQYRNRRRRAA